MVPVIWITSCKNDIESINSLAIYDSLPPEYARGIEVLYSDSGKIQARLKSPYMVKSEEDGENYEFPEGFEVTFYDAHQNPQSTITANYGISYEKKMEMEAKNNVIVSNVDKQERLYTEHLVWDRKKGIIFSDVFVKITKPDEVIYGDGLTSDESFDFYEIKNPTGEFKIDTGEPNMEDD